MKLYKTTITIWTEWNPMAQEIDPEELGREAVSGNAYCSDMDCELIEDPTQDPDWDGTEFFNFINDREDVEDLLGDKQ